MARIKDMTGYKTGRFYVLGLWGRDKWGSALWKCQCECGNIRFMTRATLIDGRHKSCGCYRYERMSKLRKKRFGEGSKNKVYFLYKQHAKRRNLNFELSKDKFELLIQQKCYYCGSDPSNISRSDHNNGDFVYNGIDRLDNNIGYTDDNCVTCCRICNRAKNNLSADEFMKWIYGVAEYNNARIHSTNLP